MWTAAGFALLKNDRGNLWGMPEDTAAGTMQSDTYTAKAAHCWRMSAKALTPAEKQDWLKLAADWTALAEEYDSVSGALPWKVEA